LSCSIFVAANDDYGTRTHVLFFTDHAWHTGLWWEMTNGGPAGSVATPSFGTYEDELVRVDGRWLFKRRKIYNEFLDGRHSGPANPVRAMEQSQ